MRLIAAVALALVLGIGVGYGGWRLWMKSSDLLRPVVVLRNADAAAVVEPPLSARIAALTSTVHPQPVDRLRLAALTFDDGPYPVATPLLLQTLHDLKVPATFFLIGRDAQQFPALTRAIVAAGHEIGDHTLTHPDLDALSDSAVRSELHGGLVALRRIAPQAGESQLFRPPHGRYTLATIRTAQAGGFTTVLWTDDPGDWRAIPGDALLAHVVTHATAPEVLLLHSGRIATVSMLPELVARYRAAGYRFVTVGTLLRSPAAPDVNRPAKISLATGT